MSKGSRIAFFGSSLVSAYWNGAATYYRGIVRALHERGHHVTFYEPDAYERQQHRDLADPDWARVVVYSAQGTEALERCLEEARDADVVVKASGVGVFDALLEARVLELRRPGNQVHHPVAAEARFEGDLAFLGNRLPDREARVEAFFLKAASLLPGSRFLLGGSGWGDRALPENVKYLGHVYTQDHNALNCSARAVLNINRDSMARFGFSPATRVFEAAGAGACILTDAFKGVELFLEPGKEILVAHSGEEVAEHVRALSGPEARRIGQAALQRVLSEHTYAHRASKVEAVLGLPSTGAHERVA
ncbi:hypothetical protein CYFUS_009175 [Cystobacter fuscus]|uniref:Spore protein YkvP/CgeB glycosyl transferase-like domain-containing protein n=1 Tax=Cystobacter fuscus TaxID=43 RepID=A0A250JIH7_9BACT|nr:glycosyltransferase [Cystobacter fuscus]ATB43695.1 hypothetical protein CYFUS_009175 [Cystobacter fuscus]